MHVQVDEAWSDIETARVDDLVARRGRQMLGDRRDAAAGERDVADGMKGLGRVEDGTALDQHACRRHGPFDIAANCSSVRVTPEG
jgi:hypothetical protein